MTAMPFMCGNCGQHFATKSAKRQHKRGDEPCTNWSATIASLNRQAEAVQRRNPELCAEMERDWERPLANTLAHHIAHARKLEEQWPDHWSTPPHTGGEQ